MDYTKLSTEKQNPKTKSLDTLKEKQILALMQSEDQKVPRAVKKVNPAIAKAVRLIVSSLKNGGRLFFFGAGTSGRLGVLEAAECPPTFNTPPSLVQAVMAGGKRAVFCSQEGAEDRGEEGRRQVRKKVRRNDVVVGVSASGVTPFVQGALSEAKKRGAKTILVACNFSSLNAKANVLIAPQTGPEVIAGSTRLKAATATKLVLNRLTVASMVRLGKVYENWMVDLQPRSQKLRARALRILKRFTGVSNAGAEKLFKQAKGRVKAAILMGRRNYSYPQARDILKKSNGFLRTALS
jgi:N-acetylmuramic acid 6-phosphate etherase